MKTLADLLAHLPADERIAVHGDDRVPVSAPVVESALDVQPGGVFVARLGRSVDGHQFIPQAIERGAAAVVGEQALHDLPLPYVQVRQAAYALGPLAAAYYDFPSHRLVVAGVTGTDGKTTTTTLLHSVLNVASGGRAGCISTLAADLGGETADTGLHVTTPPAHQVQQYMAQMVANELTHAVLEMTSHGLHQGRLHGVDIDVAVMTNVMHEHLDYHGSFDNYRAAKGMMFAMLATSQRTPGVPGISVVNADDPSADYFAAFPADRVVRYTVEGRPADFVAYDLRHEPGGTVFTVAGVEYRLQLFGAFNVANALAAIAAAAALGVETAAIQAGIGAVTALSGRMERIDEGQDFTAIVDFAHTPNALKQALTAARTVLEPGRRVIAVFGSAGLRDVEKRRLMAETSARLADFTVLTAEDPRTESLDDILRMMADGCEAQGGVEGETFIRVPDRGEALYRACQMAQPGDIVLACGKGHEQSMCFGTVEHPWDDRDALRAALRGAPLRTLPTAAP